MLFFNVYLRSFFRIIHFAVRIFRYEICPMGEWIMKVDDVNVCNEDGLCTQVAVFPFIARLERPVQFSQGEEPGVRGN